MMTSPYRLVSWVGRPLVAIIVVALLYVTWDQATYNFDTVQPGRIYRSGQMPATVLARTIHDYKIKTVLNLRGSNKDPWYLAERAATLRTGATQIDIPMSSCIWMSHTQLRILAVTLDTAEYPMLIHCQWGSERTGLVAAFAELLRTGSTLEDARAQFSIRYLFVRVSDGKVMAEHLDQYEQWLHTYRLAHDPAHFRRWVEEGFRPMTPNREQWPYDPYPLIEMTQPVPERATGPAAARPPRPRH
jgi:protein-tyrosine phosphatase